MKQIRSTITYIVIVAALLTSESMSGQRKPFTEPIGPVNRIEYLGINDDLLVFKVHLEEIRKGTTIHILDEDGNELLTERIHTSSFTRHYKFSKNTFSKIQFNVKNRKQIFAEIFNLKYRLEEKLEVIKA